MMKCFAILSMLVVSGCVAPYYGGAPSEVITVYNPPVATYRTPYVYRPYVPYGRFNYKTPYVPYGRYNTPYYHRRF